MGPSVEGPSGGLTRWSNAFVSVTVPPAFLFFFTGTAPPESDHQIETTAAPANKPRPHREVGWISMSRVVLTQPFTSGGISVTPSIVRVGKRTMFLRDPV